MDAMSLGKRIADLRKNQNMTQEELSEKLGVSPQAVSKWETGASCPDITLLPAIAALFGVTIDSLLTDNPVQETRIVAEQERRPIEDMLLRVIVLSNKGDKVKVNMPMPLVKMGLEIGLSMPEVNGMEALKGVDMVKVLSMAEKGVIGKLVEVESAEGDIVEIFVE